MDKDNLRRNKMLAWVRIGAKVLALGALTVFAVALWADLLTDKSKERIP